MRPVALGLVAAALASGCASERTLGPSDFAQQDLQEITAQAHADREKVTTMRVIGTLTEGAARFEVELQVGRNDLCLGSITQNVGSLDIRQNSEGTWIRPDRATLRATEGQTLSPEELKAAEGKWTATTQGHRLCSMDYWVNLFPIAPDGTDGSGQELTQGDEVRLTGIRTVELLATSPDSETSKKAYVSSVAPHHVLKIENSDAKSSATVTFTDFGDEFVVEAPPRQSMRKTP